jgi:hypothetical protein
MEALALGACPIQQGNAQRRPGHARASGAALARRSAATQST